MPQSWCQLMLARKQRLMRTIWTDVTDKIEEAFRRSVDLDARRIAVETHNGKVTLRGSVSSWTEREEAVTAAWSAPGVTSVDDKLAVAL